MLINKAKTLYDELTYKRHIHELRHMNTTDLVQWLTVRALKYHTNHMTYKRKKGTFMIQPMKLYVFDYGKMHYKDEDSLYSNKFLINQLIKKANMTALQEEMYIYHRSLSKLKATKNQFIKRCYGDVTSVYLDKKNDLNKKVEKCLMYILKDHHCTVERKAEDNPSKGYSHTLYIYM